MGETDVLVGVKTEVMEADLGTVGLEVEGALLDERKLGTLEGIISRGVDPTSLSVGPGRSLKIHVDAHVIHDEGNLMGALGLAVRWALEDTLVAKTRPILYVAPVDAAADSGSGGDGGDAGMRGLLKAKAKNKTRRRGQTDTTFELDHTVKAGVPILDPDQSPILVNVAMMLSGSSPVLFVDPTSTEETATDASLSAAFSPTLDGCDGMSLSTTRPISVETLMEALHLGRQTASALGQIKGVSAHDSLSSFLTL